MPRKVIIKLSLVNESKEKTDNEILTEIFHAFSSEEVVIPWCGKVESVSVSDS